MPIHVFWPVAAGEVAALEVSINGLTPLEPIAASSEAELIASLQPAVDGVVISCGDARATFLAELGQSLPEPGEFLAHLKRKAGLSDSRWSSRTRAFRYRTRSFQSSHRADDRSIIVLPRSSRTPQTSADRPTKPVSVFDSEGCRNSTADRVLR